MKKWENGSDKNRQVSIVSWHRCWHVFVCCVEWSCVMVDDWLADFLWLIHSLISVSVSSLWRPKGKLMIAIAQTKIVLVTKFEAMTNQLQPNQTQQNQDASNRIERIAKSMTSQYSIYSFIICWQEEGGASKDSSKEDLQRGESRKYDMAERILVRISTRILKKNHPKESSKRILTK